MAAFSRTWRRVETVRRGINVFYLDLSALFPEGSEITDASYEEHPVIRTGGISQPHKTLHMILYGEHNQTNITLTGAGTTVDAKFVTFMVRLTVDTLHVRRYNYTVPKELQADADAAAAAAMDYDQLPLTFAEIPPDKRGPQLVADSAAEPVAAAAGVSTDTDSLIRRLIFPPEVQAELGAVDREAADGDLTESGSRIQKSAIVAKFLSDLKSKNHAIPYRDDDAVAAPKNLLPVAAATASATNQKAQQPPAGREAPAAADVRVIVDPPPVGRRAGGGEERAGEKPAGEERRGLFERQAEELLAQQRKLAEDQERLDLNSQQRAVPPGQQRQIRGGGGQRQPQPAAAQTPSPQQPRQQSKSRDAPVANADLPPAREAKSGNADRKAAEHQEAPPPVGGGGGGGGGEDQDVARRQAEKLHEQMRILGEQQEKVNAQKEKAAAKKKERKDAAAAGKMRERKPARVKRESAGIVAKDEQVGAAKDGEGRQVGARRLQGITGASGVDVQEMGNLPWERQGVFQDLIEESGRRRALRGYETAARRGRRTLDTFADSLRFVNKLYSRHYGYEARKVPAHMPHMIDVAVMDALHARFPAEWDETSRHRIRSPNDMQFSFSYFYFLMSEKQTMTTEELFAMFDTDKTREATTVKALLHDFYETMLPLQCQFELPLDYRNRFLHMAELRSWRIYRDILKAITYLCLFLLVCFSAASFCSQQISAVSRRVWRTRRESGSPGDGSRMNV
ncbi:PREDICTED: N-acetylglucosamine-1-phosphotransferase subunits alpha/beta-like [Priapulus caudatus]|uniref:N-acetylglucosamine-1-phosphotransferase subunits alpha/beta-like n=1 Tax=Priapulus caudatus TaxID=37621 RepID=A0ABM1EXR6_PRICU|nr:PREDICTED: N-acetylglucosamine-1-phosphotransferase subunits alpha/beta-like [Priapulus caudatus]